MTKVRGFRLSSQWGPTSLSWYGGLLIRIRFIFETIRHRLFTKDLEVVEVVVTMTRLGCSHPISVVTVGNNSRTCRFGRFPYCLSLSRFPVSFVASLSSHRPAGTPGINIAHAVFFQQVTLDLLKYPLPRYLCDAGPRVP